MDDKLFQLKINWVLKYVLRVYFIKDCCSECNCYLLIFLSVSQNVFQDGVHWLSVGQCERADLLVRMQSLCFRLEQGQSSEASQRPPCSVEEAKERLRFLILRKLPRWVLEGCGISSLYLLRTSAPFSYNHPSGACWFWTMFGTALLSGHLTSSAEFFWPLAIEVWPTL